MTPEDWPKGLRSPAMSVRQASLGRPLAAIVLGLTGPALVAFGLLSIAGSGVGPGLGDDWLRAELLMWLYVLALSPLLAFFLLPVLWGLCLALVVKGFAGLGSIVILGIVIAVPAAHWLLHGDITTEAPEALLALVFAVCAQAALVWVALWWLLGARVAPATDVTRAAQEKK